MNASHAPGANDVNGGSSDKARPGKVTGDRSGDSHSDAGHDGGH